MRLFLYCTSGFLLSVFFLSFFVHPRQPVSFPSPLVFSKGKSLPSQRVIAFSGEEQGYLAPCGCSEGILGGIARRASYFSSLSRLGVKLYPVHTGDLMEKPDQISYLKLPFLLKALRQMGFPFLCLGEKDFPFFSLLKKYPLLLTNGRHPALRPFYQFPGTSLVVFNCVSLKYRFLANQAGIFLLPPRQALRKHLASFPRHFLVLVYHGDKKEGEALLREFPSLRILVTVQNSPFPKVEKKGKQWSFVLSRRGKHLSLLWLKKGKELLGEAVPLDDSIPDEPSMVRIYRQYVEKVRRVGLSVKLARTQPLSGSTFVGSQACRNCHPKAYEQWKKTAHGSAFDTLKEKGQEKNPECLVCHTVGYPFVTGFVSEDLTPGKKHVGCESCHGPGSAHLAKPGRDYGKVGKAQCLRCHTRENSPRQFQKLQRMTRLNLLRDYPHLWHGK